MRRYCQHSDVCGLMGCPVFGMGSRRTSIMIVGEAPGKNEDAKGLPFIGKAGKELDHYMSEFAHIDRKACYVTNVVKCRTNKDDRDPTPNEIAVCTAVWLANEIEEVNPAFIIAAGKIAAQWFLGGDVMMERVHGFAYPWAGKIVIPVYHPAYGLHATPKMRHIQDDFRAVGRVVRRMQGVKVVHSGDGEYGLCR